MPDKDDLGILFVHGIGEQKRGQTLTEMGEPLADWLRRWIRASPVSADSSEPTDRDSPVTIEAATIVPSNPDEPASAVVSVNQSKWILAESWWAEVFLGARFSQLARWGLIVGPVILASHISLIIQRILVTSETIRMRLSGASRPLPPVVISGIVIAVASVGTLVALVVAAIAALMAFLFELLAIALMIVAVVPIPGIRDLLTRLQLRLANGLGDSYVLSQSPLQYTAMVDRVQRDLGWLADRCRRVVVVAHSQGAAVAYEAVRDADQREPQVRLLITFGQGLRKLRMLTLLNRKSVLTWSGRGFWTLFILSSLGLLTFGLGSIVLTCRALHCGGAPIAPDVVIWQAILNEVWSGWGVLTILALSVVLISQLVIASRAQSGESVLSDELQRELRAMGLQPNGFEWMDLYASADPVPNGPLVGRDREVPGFRSIRVRNLGSTLSDHTTYWSNHTDFVTKVAISITSVLGWRLNEAQEGDTERLELGRLTRSRRVAVLTAHRVVAIVTWLSILASFGRSLPVIGRTVVEPLPDELPVIGTIGEFPNFVYGAAAAAVIGLVIYVWFLIGRLVWSWGIASDDHRFFAREDTARYWDSTPHFLSFLWLALGIGAGAAAVLGIAGAAGIVWLYVAAVLMGWLITSLVPSIAAEESISSVAPYAGPEAAAAPPGPAAGTAG